MTFGGALFLLAAGAILRFAVSDAIEGVDLSVVGLILMIVGALGLVLALWQTDRFTRTTEVVERRDEPRGPPR